MSSWQVSGYIEDREVGRGASGRVVAATHAASGRWVAIKYLNSDLVGSPGFLAAFRQEAQLLSEIDVPHVVRVLEYVEEPDGAAIVMELVAGVSLYELITQQGPATPESALTVLKGSLLGLATAHSLGVVHRDYKPENVLVNPDGVSKLTDFGVATRAGYQAPAAGTPLYMAPEQWAGHPASPASDIYAATAVFFECLTGRPPFEGQIGQLRQMHENAPVPSAVVGAEPLRGLLERGMAKNAADRPPDAAAFVSELEDAAFAAAGADWEDRGRSQLKERVAALLLLLGGGVAGGAGAEFVTTQLGGGGTGAGSGGTGNGSGAAGPGSGGTGNGSGAAGPGSGWRSLARRRTTVLTAATVVTVAAVVAGGIAIASAASHHHQPGHASTASTQRALSTSTALPTAPPTRKPSPSASVTPAAPVVTIALASTPASPRSVQCGTTPPTFTVTGEITSSTAADVSYSWLRSNGTQTGVQTVSIGAGETVDVTDSLTAASDSYSGSDTLQVSSPVSASGSIPITVTCVNSHVSSVTVSNVTVNNVTGCPVSGITGSFTVTIEASSPAPVTLTWQTSQSASTSPGTPIQDSGSVMVSGRTSYQVSFPVPGASPVGFGSIPSGSCFRTYFVVQVTAKGTDGVPAGGSGSVGPFFT